MIFMNQWRRVAALCDQGCRYDRPQHWGNVVPPPMTAALVMFFTKELRLLCGEGEGDDTLIEAYDPCSSHNGIGKQSQHHKEVVQSDEVVEETPNATLVVSGGTALGQCCGLSLRHHPLYPMRSPCGTGS
ncbi:hypothetical protein PIB30_042948 [Stylosanthes scabra]|uniref:Uncharacterized protein n=1 Tax=Stylosanthes scabra TaxID=79078 RepID=A0ABU6YG06_9FABA|nr:hypothetical protein [Stylosanthes scabra]